MEEVTERPRVIKASEGEQMEKVIKAGKRTYFFDLKTTQDGDHFLLITESKKKLNDDGEPYFEKHKVYLYSEDFDVFAHELVQFIDQYKAKHPQEKVRVIRHQQSKSEPQPQTESPVFFNPQSDLEEFDESMMDYSSVEYEDLER
jgi:hypothetical protein